jgi:4-aminobutyrate aminotransferase / (S)-3-amino-2-methylpropionate transaminase / 5-aminovalerate transaminase
MMPVSQDETRVLLSARNSAIPRGVIAAHPIFAARAEGNRMWDVDGREYLDFAAGIGVLNVGHNHPRVVAAVRRQLEALTHTCFQVVMYEPYVRLAERLAQLIGGSRPTKTFFATTGAEAVENGVKIARAATGRSAVVAFDGGFHGRTLMGMTLTGMAAPYKQNFGPFAPGIYHAPYPYEYRGWTAERALARLHELFATQASPEHIAAMIIEPQLGDGGFVPAPPQFLRGLRAICDEHKIVLICDEIQTGFGRTGLMFGYEHARIEPDLVLLAKGLADGFPISAVVGAAQLMDAPEPGGLGGTYAGNPLACAAALAVLDTFEQEDLLSHAASLGRTLREGLIDLFETHGCIGDVRGLGPMVAFELVQSRATKDPDPSLTSAILDAARARGLIVIRCGIYRNVVRLLPPLLTSPDEARRAIRILDDAIRDATARGR